MKPTCEYLTRAGQHAPLERCGKPAKHRATQGARLFYCDDCAAIVSRSIEIKPIKETKGQS
jgi:hypothetical protein